MILVTGGAGYIGSHICVGLIKAGFQIIIFDNFSHSSSVVFERLSSITDGAHIEVAEGDVCSSEQLSEGL